MTRNVLLIEQKVHIDEFTHYVRAWRVEECLRHKTFFVTFRLTYQRGVNTLYFQEDYPNLTLLSKKMGRFMRMLQKKMLRSILTSSYNH